MYYYCYYRVWHDNSVVVTLTTSDLCVYCILYKGGISPENVSVFFYTLPWKEEVQARQHKNNNSRGNTESPSSSSLVLRVSRGMRRGWRPSGALQLRPGGPQALRQGPRTTVVNINKKEGKPSHFTQFRGN